MQLTIRYGPSFSWETFSRGLKRAFLVLLAVSAFKGLEVAWWTFVADGPTFAARVPAIALGVALIASTYSKQLVGFAMSAAWPLWMISMNDPSWWSMTGAKPSEFLIGNTIRLTLDIGTALFFGVLPPLTERLYGWRLRLAYGAYLAGTFVIAFLDWRRAAV